jgi:hypothetical protein
MYIKQFGQSTTQMKQGLNKSPVKSQIYWYVNSLFTQRNSIYL